MANYLHSGYFFSLCSFLFWCYLFSVYFSVVCYSTSLCLKPSPLWSLQADCFLIGGVPEVVVVMVTRWRDLEGWTLGKGWRGPTQENWGQHSFEVVTSENVCVPAYTHLYYIVWTKFCFVPNILAGGHSGQSSNLLTGRDLALGLRV